MSNPEASPSPPPPRAPQRVWEGFLEILAFVLVASVLVAGPRVLTVVAALRGLAAPSRDPVVLRPPTRALPSPVAPATPARARAQLPAPPSAPAVTPRPARRAPAVVASPRARRPAPAPMPSPTASPVPADAARLQHFLALMDQGIALYRSGWYGPALARFRQAAALRPTSPYAHLWVGRAAVAAQRYDEAREALERVVALAPGTPQAKEAEALLEELSSNGM